MAYQKGFYGVGIAGEDTGSKGLIKALGSMSKGLSTLAQAEGIELDKKVLAEAEKAARIDNFKSYQDAVDKGEIENTKSDFFIAHYDNIKGQNAGSEYQTKKMLAYETFIGDQSSQDIDDVDGSGYMAWSSQYDADNYKNYSNNSSYFLKSLDTSVKTVNQQLSAKYATHNATRMKLKYAQNYGIAVEDVLKQGTFGTQSDNRIKSMYQQINKLDQTSNQFRALTNTERNQLVIQSFKNEIARRASLSNLNSDYDQAIQLAESLLNYKRANGSSFLTGEDREKWLEEIDKLKTERINHEQKKLDYAVSVKVKEYIDFQEKDLVNQFGTAANSFMGKGATRAAFAIPRFKEEVDELVFRNQSLDADDPDKLDRFGLQQEISNIKQNLLDLYKSSGSTKNIIGYDPKQQYKFVIRRDYSKVNAAVSFIAMQTKAQATGESSVKPENFEQFLLNNPQHGTVIKFMVNSAKANGYMKDGSPDLVGWWKDYKTWHKGVSK